MQNAALIATIARLDEELQREKKKRQALELAIFLWFCWPYIKATLKWFWRASVFTAKRILWPLSKWLFSIVTFRSLRNDLIRAGSINGPLQAEAPVSKPVV